jgi:hypothetical protein
MLLFSKFNIKSEYVNLANIYIKFNLIFFLINFRMARVVKKLCFYISIIVLCALFIIFRNDINFYLFIYKRTQPKI